MLEGRLTADARRGPSPTAEEDLNQTQAPANLSNLEPSSDARQPSRAPRQTIGCGQLRTKTTGERKGNRAPVLRSGELAPLAARISPQRTQSKAQRSRLTPVRLTPDTTRHPRPTLTRARASSSSTDSCPTRPVFRNAHAAIHRSE